MLGGLRKRTVISLEPIIGQSHAVRLLTRMLENDRLPHALLFTGIDGIGKQTAAKALAMALNCLRSAGVLACMECRCCKKVISGNHPDIIIVEPSSRFIKIGQIRALRKHLSFAPVEGGRRVIIINDAHCMNVEASNAILKILEEPPDNTHVVLTAHQTSDLLPTIVSRCQHIAFNPVPVAKIVEELANRRDVDEDTATTIAVLAKGSLGRAMSADIEKWMGWRKELLGRVISLSGGSMHTLFGFAEEVSKDKDKLQDTLDMFIMWFRDILICKFHPEKILNNDYAPRIERISKEFSVDELLNRITAIFATQRAVLKNANRRLALEVLLLNLYLSS
ncbi:MAG: DNA polymerase III subunit delta' [Desulfobacterales bacterium S7086C20]|nr:MAG: DNA polymerase III subunit delta' [Desulfobacterales bacterium S7086C20]